MKPTRMVLLLAFAALLPGCAPRENEGVQKQDLLASVGNDYKNFYSRNNAKYLIIGFAGGGILANTNADQDVNNWYQENQRSADSDRYAKLAKKLGDGMITVPVSLAGFALGQVSDKEPLHTIGEWGGRTARAYAVGRPFMLGAQYTIDGSRPTEPEGSRWRPFKDNNGISGHTFAGSVPFMTAATMTDSVPLKVACYGGSTLAGWSRINDRGHYFSQVFLGWWIGYLAVRSVDKTQADWRKMQVVPMVDDDFAGVGIHMGF